MICRTVRLTILALRQEDSFPQENLKNSEGEVSIQNWRLGNFRMQTLQGSRLTRQARTTTIPQPYQRDIKGLASFF